MDSKSQEIGKGFNKILEDAERDKIIKKAHKDDWDINKSELDLNRFETLKKQGKNPSDYGYDEKNGYKG